MRIRVPAREWYVTEAGERITRQEKEAAEQEEAEVAGTLQGGEAPLRLNMAGNGLTAGKLSRARVRFFVARDVQTVTTRHMHYPSGTTMQEEATGWGSLLVTAMVRVPWWRRFFFDLQRFNADEAILISSVACERCLNALNWRYRVRGHHGKRLGYSEYSPQYVQTFTRCEFCIEPRRIPSGSVVYQHTIPAEPDGSLGWAMRVRDGAGAWVTIGRGKGPLRAPGKNGPPKPA